MLKKEDGAPEIDKYVFARVGPFNQYWLARICCALFERNTSSLNGRTVYETAFQCFQYTVYTNVQSWHMIVRVFQNNSRWSREGYLLVIFISTKSTYDILRRKLRQKWFEMPNSRETNENFLPVEACIYHYCPLASSSADTHVSSSKLH